MKKRSVILPVLFILIVVLTKCIDPYNPRIDKYQSLMVVEALLTDSETPGYVRLTRTSVTPDEVAATITGARILITDDLGNSTSLSETENGIYQTDNPDFRGVAGREYTLKIHTSDGIYYESDPVVLTGTGAIDTVYFEKDTRITDDGEVQDGIMIYVDSKGLTGNRYYRWTYEEWWKFNIPYPVTHEYVDEDHIYEIPIENVTCYKNRKSDEVLIQLSDTEANMEFIKKPIYFIASEKSDRLLIQYCIEVSQYAITEKEFEFWRLMKEINESGGDIFDKQPFQIISNIYCKSDPGQKVLGYFEVCGKSKKRIYIRGSEIAALGLKPYQYSCDMVMKGPQDYTPSEIPITFDRIYHNYIMQNYNFVAPDYVIPNILNRLVFVDKYCSDCTASGSPEKPDFWVDLE
jgi:hypothetical protein